MAIYCENCGAPNDDYAICCTNCGAMLNRDPIPEAPVNYAPQNPWAAAFKQNIKLIIAVVSVLALVIGIMNLFGTYDVSASASFMGEKESGSGPLSELREEFPEDIFLFIVSSFVLGIGCIASAGLGGYSVYLLLQDGFGSKKFFQLSIWVGLISSVLSLLLALIGCRVTYWGITMSFGIHITYWLSLILFVALLCADKLLLKNDYAPLK